MGKYRKKPVVVDAWAWDEQLSTLDMLRLEGMIASAYTSHKDHEYCRNLRIHTLEGPMRAEFGDMIIRGVNGEFYPCKPDIFDKTYEEVTCQKA
jgi:hypothetical protein